MFSPFLSLVPLLLLLITLDITIPITATSSETSFVYGGCSQTKYLPGSQYESYVNSALTTLVNSAMYTPYYNFTTESTPNSPVSALYQCRGDLSQSSCSNCVQRALSQLGVICVSSCGGALQLEGCFVKYDNATFVGVEDKTVVVRKCGSSSSSSSPDELGRREQVLNYLLMSGRNEFYRVGESGDVRGVAQCVGDLSLNQCRDCLGYAVQQLKSVCVQVSWGDVYLGKCYVRISNGGSDSDGSNGSSQDDEIEKTLSILVGLIAGVALLIIFFAFIRKLCDGKDGK